MIDALLRWSITHRVAVIVAGFALAIAGWIATAHVPIDAIPDLSEKQVIAFANWPGHSPNEVDAQVTAPIAAELRGIRGVRVVRATSDPGYAWLSLILDDSAQTDTIRRAAAERLAQANNRLPSGVVAQLAPDAAPTGQIFWYTVEGGGLDLAQLRALQDFYVGPQLATTIGVAEVASVGGTPMEYQVEIDPQRMRARGVTLDAIARAVAQSNAAAGAGVVHKANSEFVVRAGNLLGSGEDSTGDARILVIRQLERVPVSNARGENIPLIEIAHIGVGSSPRRGVLEKDGIEVTGGVVQMTQGENPRRVTQRIKSKIEELSVGLPPGVRVVPFYDRTPLIDSAVGAVSSSLIEAMFTATVCVLLILLHLRASFVISVTLPLAALGSFALMWLLHATGIAAIQINIMSLAGIAISVGVLVDSSIVMTENAMHRLRDSHGDQPVRGDIRPVVLEAGRQVGKPILFSIMIMLLSFLPVFALGGMEGRMFFPLAIGKCFCLVVVAVLSVTLVPALCTFLLKGRMRGEMQSSLVRAIIEVYRPVLSSLLERPGPLILVLGATFIAASATLGVPALTLGMLAAALFVHAWQEPRRGWRMGGFLLLALVAGLADKFIKPLDREFMAALDEGMVMDMPITVPRAGVTQSTDDVKARNMILCRFPEVAMVVGKAGRAESPSDPAPLDMIETMIEFRPRELWPRRVLRRADAHPQTLRVFDALKHAGLIRDDAPKDGLDEVTDTALARTVALLREYAYQRHQEFLRTSGTDPATLAFKGLSADLKRRWIEFTQQVDAELLPRAASTYTRLAIEAVLAHSGATSPQLARYIQEIEAFRHVDQSRIPHHHAAGDMSRTAALPTQIQPQPQLDALQAALSRRFEAGLVLHRRDRAELVSFGGELDRAVPMPGWANVWTTPIQNRVNMLATGVNSTIGVRVLGTNLDQVVETSEQIAEILKSVPGAVDVIADPIRGKGTIDVRLDRTRAGREGVSSAELNEAVEIAIGGRIVTNVLQGRERYPVRIRYGREWRGDDTSIEHVVIDRPAPEDPRGVRYLAVSDVADVLVSEGPATIKSENGQVRNYVRLNVRGRPIHEFLTDARRAVAARVALPPGTHIEWTGQYEYEERARATLMVVVPTVLILILMILYATYRDMADALTMLLAVPGAAAGGLLFQAVTGTKLSVTVWIGYIACFGMATSTGIIMMVYLRDALARAGGLQAIASTDQLKATVLEGAVQRLRPKLLTEGTTLLALAPLLWSHGVASEVIRPMAAPVFGGLLIADEVIDLLLPIIFYRIRLKRWQRLNQASTLQTNHTDARPQ